MSVGWGIISTGGHPDLRVVPGMKVAENTKVVAVYSRDITTAEAFAQKHEIPKAYDSIDALLCDPGVNAVYIASPNFLHCAHTLKAAELGKHVLVEKPMAINASEAIDMIRACRARGVKLGVGFQLRHHPGHKKAQTLIQDGILGKTSLAQAQWCVGVRGVSEPPLRTGRSEWWDKSEMVGGAPAIMGMGVHAIDLLHFLLGQPTLDVAAITDGQTRERPLETVAVVALRFADGTIGTICCGRRMPDTENDAMIYGSNGKIALRAMLGQSRVGVLEVVSESANMSETYTSEIVNLFKLQTEAFNRAVEGKEDFHASGEDGLLVVQVTSAIIESASTGRTVKVSYVRP